MASGDRDARDTMTRALKVAVAFGTRPEAIKCAPVVSELRRRSNVALSVVTTAQHRRLLDQVLTVFGIVPDVDLGVMEPHQTLAGLSARVLTAFDGHLASHAPDVLLVQGDTTTAFVCALTAFYRRIPVGHIEAGLRTPTVADPFPEEANRRLASIVSTVHFAPTERARRALLAEGVAADAVYLTGNTVVDALTEVRSAPAYRAARPAVVPAAGERLVLVTLHRRESWGEPLAGMCRAIRRVAESHEGVRAVLPVHLNPEVQGIVRRELEGCTSVALVEPLDYLTFVAQMDASTFVLTDSGGVQEEAPSLGKPVLVLRNTTERPEAVDAGTARLIGTDPEAIFQAASLLLTDSAAYARMAHATSPFGDGRAAGRIADVLEARFGKAVA